MSTDNMKKGRFDQLGLPPMELAESSENRPNNNGMYKCLFPILQKVMIILLLTIFGVGTYVLLSKILENYESPINTQIIYIKENSEPSNMFHFLRLFNTTSDTEISRRKRNTDPVIDPNLDLDEFNSINFNEDQLEKAREIIMNHDITCSEEDKEGICKDLVTKLKEITENKDSTKQEGDSSKVTLDTDNNKTKLSEGATTDVAKREAFPIPHEGSIVDTVPLPLGLSKNSQYDFTHSSENSNNCLMNILKMYSRAQDYSAQSEEDFPRQEPHYDRPLLPRGRSDAMPTEGLFNSSLEITCATGTVACLSGDSCIEKKQWCDGHVDCDDVSDEAGCNCKSRVDKSRLCDGYFDCPFGEDELGCYGCSESTFSCEDLDINSQSTCFSKEQRCNNVPDCPNNKDENECNMLAPSLLMKPVFSVSNTEGFLHRNFKGEWYAVCKNPYMWAHDACRREAGLIIRPPIIEIVPVDPMLKINYINTNHGGFVHTTDNCLNSSAVYVTCPDLLCGTRVQSASQLIRENNAIENHLFGRNKRFLRPNHPTFYVYRRKRDVGSKTNYGIKFGTSRMEDPFVKMRNKRTESRVVGGNPSQPAAWPWLVALYRDGMFHCGGVIISHSWIISAAHCVHKFWDHYYEVQVGMLRRFSFSPQEHIHKVTHVIVNQKYNQKDMKNDLSLIKVKPAIQFSRWVRPVCLPNPDTAGPNWLWGPSAGTQCTAVGWGATVEHGPDPDHMREVEVPIWENCKYKEDRAGKEICAGLREGGKDACQGDSGGPLLCRNPLNSQQWYVAGIVSHGDGCGRESEPGVYTRVSLFVKWIRYHTASKSLPIIQPVQKCPGFKCQSGISKCLPIKRKCDRIIDCLDGDDEVNCNFKNILSTFNDNVFSAATTNFTEEIFARKDDRTESNNVEKETSTTVLNVVSSTTESEVITSSKSTVIKNQENKDLIKSVEEVEQPDIQQSRLNENLNLRSSEDSSNVDKPVTLSQSDDSTSNEFISKGRGDAESIAIEFIGESLESRSSVLGKLREHTTETNIDDNFNTEPEVMEPTSEASTSIFEQHPQANLDITTQNNKNEKNEIPLITQHNLEQNQNDFKFTTRSEDLIVKLLPTTHLDLPDQTVEETEHITQATTVLNKNQTKDDLSKTLSDFDIENIIISELQPATLRRKHHIPKEFQCRRIFQMIPYRHHCDRKADCEDGTDELDCSCSDYLLTFDEKLVCDGNYDCADGHDETSCYSCEENQYLCKQSKICLPLNNICDGTPQCPKGEDELDCFALTNGKEIQFNLDERPAVNLEGYLTQKRNNDWQVVCDDKLTLDQQEQTATHICRYLGFSSANKFKVKYINIKEDDIAMHTLDFKTKRIKRDVVQRSPVHFVYRQVNDQNDASQHMLLQNAQVIKEECVPNITKTCKSLYIVCDHTLFTDSDELNGIFLRNTNYAIHMWPWVAKVFIDGEYKCTGVLIDLSWVLVSESCLWDSMLNRDYVTVVLGSHRTLEATIGMHEQVYQVDAKKDIFRSKITLLHLKEPAYYSNVVKPMVVSSSFTYLDPKSTCVAVGEDDKNNTLSITLEETSENCKRNNRCFVRKSNVTLCSPNISSNRHWAGIISCHTDEGWFPAASFVDSRGECGMGDHINAIDIENLKYEISHVNNSKGIPYLVTKSLTDDCEGIRCGRGRCVPLVQICDGVKDCEDSNDESEIACEQKNDKCKDPYHSGCECSSGQMKCRNGKCISKELFKDGSNDCGDGTDEPGRSSCSHYLARVMPSRLCDGILHCDDRSDEDPMFCKCFAKNTYKCGGNFRVDHCVPQDTVCDGVRDCPNGEDEQTCIALNAPQGTPHGIGQVIVRSHGVWHSKCYPTQNHTKSELEAICAELGFISGHAKQIHQIEDLTVHPHNNLVLDSFTNVILNNNTIIKMRNTHEPMAKAVYDKELQDCYPVFIECL
ncbi:unnamed protein product [Arctia plantaginis]|uniref:Serine protease nudel n=1 Tax=Arctia plantaginis TaxID=874455 RepID=A0A8S0ZYC5_ARCPL|nr:unnamed protein product [Arctia plantaginis]